MFFGPDGLSLRRGQRRDQRVEACRPCLLWPTDAPDLQQQGVIMDLNRHGLLVRALEPIPPGTAVTVQMMRDEDFRHTLAPPLEGEVVRNEAQADGLYDHGIRLEAQEIKRVESKPVRIEQRRSQPARRSRMHTVDFTVGDRGIRRNG